MNISRMAQIAFLSAATFCRERNPAQGQPTMALQDGGSSLSGLGDGRVDSNRANQIVRDGGPAITEENCRAYLDNLNRIITGADPGRFPESERQLREIYRDTGIRFHVVMGSREELLLHRLYRLAEERLPDQFDFSVTNPIIVNGRSVGRLRNAFTLHRVCRGDGSIELTFDGRVVNSGNSVNATHEVVRGGNLVPVSEIGNPIPASVCEIP